MRFYCGCGVLPQCSSYWPAGGTGFASALFARELQVTSGEASATQPETSFPGIPYDVLRYYTLLALSSASE